MESLRTDMVLPANSIFLITRASSPILTTWILLFKDRRTVTAEAEAVSASPDAGPFKSTPPDPSAVPNLCKDRTQLREGVEGGGPVAEHAGLAHLGQEEDLLNAGSGSTGGGRRLGEGGLQPRR